MVKINNFWKLLLVLIGNCTLILPMQAQLIPDQTLKEESSVVNQIDNINERIDGGAIRGSNLFHSFQELNVGEGRGVYFSNPAGVNNILNRVTGGNPSSIFGKLGVLGNANLFLINPNGIIFGKNGRLDLNGSFVATTASSLLFNNNFEFSTNKPQPVPLLTINFPIGFLFNSKPGDIIVQGNGSSISTSLFGSTPILPENNQNGLQLPPGQNLTLLGGNITLDGGVLIAEGGKIELSSIKEEGIVNIVSTPSTGISFDSHNLQKGTIALIKQSLIDASSPSIGKNAGSIRVEGAFIILSDGSLLLLNNQGQSSGNIFITATDSIFLQGISAAQSLRSGIATETLEISTGKGGNISLSTKNFVLENGGGLVTTTYSNSPLGEAGDINVLADNLIIRKGSNISSITFGIAQGGNLEISAKEIEISGFLPLSSPIEQQLPFLAGLVSQITTSSFTIGNGGEIKISAQNVNLANGGNITTSVFGEGKGGNITLNADFIVNITGISPFGISSTIGSSTFNQAQAGNLTVNTSKLLIREGGIINASTYATGNAGTLTINASEFVEVSGISEINSSAAILNENLKEDFNLSDRPSGSSGKLTINAPEIQVKNGARIGVFNQGTGNAGSLNLNIDRLFLDNNASVTATSASGLGGNIEALFRYLGLRGESRISTNAGGTGDGGNITLKGENLTLLQNSTISADAEAGDGGRVNIDVKGLFAPPGSITANSRFGNPGSVEIGKINPLQNFATPSDNFTPTEPTFASCNNTQQPILKIASTTGTGIAPDKGIDTSIDLIPVAPNLEQLPIQEATGWETTASGSIILVASNLPFEQYTLGYQHYQKGEYKSAIALWEQLLNQSQYIPNLATIHNAIASAYRLMGQLPSAIEYQQIALALWQQTPNSPETIIAASIELAELYNDSGLTNYSLPLTEKILSLPSIEQNSKLKAASQQVRGNAYLIQGDWKDAIASFKESLKTAPTDLELTQSTLNNLTTAYNEQSQQYQTQSKTASDLKQKFFAEEKEQYAQKAQQEAISTVKKAIEINQGQNSLSALQANLNAAKLLNNPNYIKEAIAIFNNLPSSTDKAKAAINLAQTIPPIQAVEILSTAISIANQLQDHTTLSYASTELGKLYFQSGQYKEAQLVATQALASAQLTQNPDILYRASWLLGRIHLALNQLQVAKASYNEAIDNLEKIGGANSPWLDFNSEVEPVYRELLSILLPSSSPQETLETLSLFESLQVAKLNEFFGDNCLTSYRQPEPLLTCT